MRREPASPSIARLTRYGLALWLGCLLLTLQSDRFAWGTSDLARPLIEFVCGWGALFAVYLAALQPAIHASSSAEVWGRILLIAIACRVVLIFSTPVQELDYYRYLWDGHTALAGVSPYRYSPQQVLAAPSDQWLPADLRRLVTLRDTSPQAATIAARVHFGDLPSVYPPVSLAVFTASVACTPAAARVETAIVILKTWIVLFDLGTLLLLARLLRWVGLPVGWTVAYGWCPLVLKEFANSGHLDSIAVCLSVAAVTAFVRAMFSSGDSSPDGGGGRIDPQSSRVLLRWSSVALGLAIGAKLYPVILTPLFVFTIWRQQGARRGLEFVAILTVVTLAVCSPMLAGGASRDSTTAPTSELESNGPPIPHETTAPLKPAAAGSSLAPQETQRSLRVFLSQWKMNDFVFLILESNLSVASPPPDPWFAVTPVAWRAAWTQSLATHLGLPPERCGYLLARGVLSLVFLCLAIRWAWTAARSGQPLPWLQATFLTVAWFWALQPTLNPWYWTWALPLLPFARRSAWYWVSGLLGIYYLRFWFGGQFDGRLVWGTPYRGEYFFHFVVVWVEHLPWMLGLLVEPVWRHPADLCGPSQTQRPPRPILRASQSRLRD